MIALSRREQRKLETYEKHKKQCKWCGVTFSARDRTFCSDECRRKDVDNKLVYSCAQCGKSVRKRTVSTARFQFCNKQCQDAYHADTGYCRTKKEICRRNKSRRLMRKIKAEKSDLRKSNSEGFKWWSLCKRQCLHGESKIKDAWESRIESACRLLRVRDDPVFKLTKQEFWCWDSRIAKERIGKLKNKVSSQEELKWTQRINDAAKNSYKRIKRKASRIGMHG